MSAANELLMDIEQGKVTEGWWGFGGGWKGVKEQEKCEPELKHG